MKFTSPERVLLTLKTQRAENKNLRAENLALKEKLAKALESSSVPIDDNLNNDLVDIFHGIPEKKVPPFMRLFWEEQQRYLRTKNKNQLRYHPAIIKYCLSIAAKSSSAYEQMRLDEKDGSGVLLLPKSKNFEKVSKLYENSTRLQP